MLLIKILYMIIIEAINTLIRGKDVNNYELISPKGNLFSNTLLY